MKNKRPQYSLSMKSSSSPTFKHLSVTFKEGVLRCAEYQLAIEEFLEIYIDGAPYAVTMRLPGDDLHLVTGFCFTEGIIQSVDEIAAVSPCTGSAAGKRIFVELNKAEGGMKSSYRQRAPFLSQSSCGLCGKSEIGEVFVDIAAVSGFNPVELEEVFSLKKAFEARQDVYRRTGVTHSAAIFGYDQRMLAFGEDIGRHNALDKAIGRVLCARENRQAYIGIVSSRLSFEMVQKAAVLGLEILCGLSGPTGKAVELADQLNISLIGFLRQESMTVYTHWQRLLTPQLSRAEVTPLSCGSKSESPS